VSEKRSLRAPTTQKLISGLASLLLLAGSTVVVGAQATGPIRGQGTVRCASWISDHRNETLIASAQNAWLMGFMSAYHSHSGLAPKVPNSELIALITRHCRTNTNDTLYQAASALVRELSGSLNRN
jgi:hypothetical protein